MKKTIVLFALGVMLLLSCQTEKNSNSGVLNDIFIPLDLMGMVHAGYANGKSEMIEEEYALLDEIGVRWMMRDFSWELIQSERGVWDWTVYDKYVEDANNHDKKILGLLAYDVPWIHGDYDERKKRYACGHKAWQGKPRIAAGADEIAAFCEYVRETVLRYKDSVGAWCIWNEPNMKNIFWSGTPDEFFTLTKAAAAAIREADPEALILGGALNPGADNSVWTRGLFRSGAMDQVDLFAYHPYANNAALSAQVYKKFKDYVSKYGFEDRVWITEVGYPLDKGPGGYDSKVSEALMPEVTVKTITLFAAAGVQHIFWYEMFDYGKNMPSGDSEAWFGLVDFDTFTKKGGGEAYGLCALNLPGKTFRPSLSVHQGLPPAVAVYYFEGSGTHTLVIWNERASKPREVKVYLPGSNQQLRNIADGSSAPIAEISTHTLEAGNSLLFFTWENTDLSKIPSVSPY